VNILGLAALGAALTLIVVGALQVFGVTTLGAEDMLDILFILLGTATLAGAFSSSGHLPTWPRGGRG
jgi:hypothetical protein